MLAAQSGVHGEATGAQGHGEVGRSVERVESGSSEGGEVAYCKAQKHATWHVSRHRRLQGQAASTCTKYMYHSTRPTTSRLWYAR
jgi:hypothetical protein